MQNKKLHKTTNLPCKRTCLYSMVSKKKETDGIWNLKAQKKFPIEQGRYKSNLKGGDLKCVVVGDYGVGKTSLLWTYALNEYRSLQNSSMH